MWIVAGELEVFEFKDVDILDVWIQFQARQWPAFAGELLARLVEMVFVKMEIAERVNEIPWREIDDLCHHHCEYRIRSDVERHTEKQVGAALI